MKEASKLLIFLQGTVNREVWGLQVLVAVTIQQEALVAEARIPGTTLPLTGKHIKPSNIALPNWLRGVIHTLHLRVRLRCHKQKGSLQFNYVFHTKTRTSKHFGHLSKWGVWTYWYLTSVFAISQAGLGLIVQSTPNSIKIKRTRKGRWIQNSSTSIMHILEATGQMFVKLRET